MKLIHSPVRSCGLKPRLSARWPARWPALLPLILLWGCGTASPPPQYYQLRALPSAAEAAAAMPAATPSGLTIQLMPVELPELLQRDTLLLAQGSAGVQALANHRWAEPLRDAVPRVLLQDLQTLLGAARVWAAPLPPGLVLQRQWRVQVLALQADEARSQVRLLARVVSADVAGRGAPRVQQLDLSEPVRGSDVDALVAAHRQVLWQLAQALAQGERNAAP